MTCVYVRAVGLGRLRTSCVLRRRLVAGRWWGRPGRLVLCVRLRVGVRVRVRVRVRVCGCVCVCVCAFRWDDPPNWGWVTYSGRRACRICLRSGRGSDGNVYDALLRLEVFGDQLPQTLEPA